MEVQCENAIEIAWNPSSDQVLKQQAFDYLDRFRSDPSAWQTCLQLFTRTPKTSEIVRHTTLEIINSTLQANQSSAQTAVQIRDALLRYNENAYASGSNRNNKDSKAIQNKLAQTFTFLFTALYATEWNNFFIDLWAPAELELRSGQRDGPATGFYLRMLASVHDEIADQLINTTNERQKIFTDLKDLIRVRDASRIATTWQEILSNWRSIGSSIVELCLKTISRWVSWSDISLVVKESMLEHLYALATGKDASKSNSMETGPRDAAIEVFTEIVAKKMQPSEKIELIGFININAVLDELISAPSLNSSRGTPDYDTDLAENVAKLVNTVVLDVVKVLDSTQGQVEAQKQANILLQQFTPKLLRFLSDEFDEVCSTVIPALTEELTLFRKLSKLNGSLPQAHADSLDPILKAIIGKMRYDDTSSWGEDDEETDEAEFQDLRKRLKIGQQIVATIDEKLYMNTLGDLVQSTFDRYREQQGRIDWRDLDVALLELFLFGELAVRNSGLYQKKLPSTAASERLIHLMSMMMDLDIASFPHPVIKVSFIDICVRYHSFFDQNTRFTPKVLEDFVRFMHSDHNKVKMRSWHDFLRFTRLIRTQLTEIAETIVGAINDLLVIKAEVSDGSTNDDMSSSQRDPMEDAIFQNQLSLFEAVGCISSLATVPGDVQVRITRSVLDPLLANINEHVNAAANSDEKALLQIHHLIEATGTLARGFSDWVPGRSGTPVIDPVIEQFEKASNTVLNALATLKDFPVIRSASRFAFSRFIGVLGFKILKEVPSWIEGLLTEKSTKDEMVAFLRILIQVFFHFKSQIFEIVDTLLSPLLRKIFASFSEPLNGTDDDIQLGGLRREYMSFLTSLLNQGLESTLVSPKNQSIFEDVIVSIEHFAKDMTQLNDSKTAVLLISKMCDTWGGSRIPVDSMSSAPSLPGFDQFMITRFSPLTWTIMTNPHFNPKEPQTEKLIGELATLQQNILAKTGAQYTTYLRDTELPNLGLQQGPTIEYVHAMATVDTKGFRQFLQRFLQQGR